MTSGMGKGEVRDGDTDRGALQLLHCSVHVILGVAMRMCMCPMMYI